jgi:hypothetical protein
VKNRASENRKFSAGWLLRAAIVLCGGILLVWMAFKIRAVEGLVRANPPAALTVAPDDPRAVIRAAMREFHSQNGKVNQQTLDAVRSAFAKAPLAYEPLILFAIDAQVRGQLGLAERLLTEARNRNPRSKVGRLLLLNIQLGAGQLEAAVNEMKMLRRLLPAAGEAIAIELATFYKQEKTRPSVKRILMKDEETKGAVLEQLIKTDADLPLITDLAGTVSPVRGNAPPPAWLPLLIERLIAEQQQGRAVDLWRQASGIEDRGAKLGIYDPAFSGLRGLPPFNWQFPEGTSGVAELRQGGGLDVEYYGRDAGTLAQQLLVLPAGRYRLLVRAEAPPESEGGRLSWRISCRNSKARLMDMAVSGAGGGTWSGSASFSIAPGCSSQWLTLEGTPSEMPKPRNVTIVDLKLERAS